MSRTVRITGALQRVRCMQLLCCVYVFMQCLSWELLHELPDIPF